MSIIDEIIKIINSLSEDDVYYTYNLLQELYGSRD